MSIGFGGGYGKSNSETNSQQSQNQQINPWAPALPYLESFLSTLGGYGASNIAPTSAQNTAFTQLERNAGAGNPFTNQIKALTNADFNATSNAPAIAQAQQQLQSQLGGYARGDYLDPTKNSYISSALTTVANDTQNRINQEFAGAGRDLSGMNQQTMARGLAQAEAPLLLGQYNQNVGNQFNAANTLDTSAVNAAMAGQNLNEQALATRAQGIGNAQNYLQAQNYGPNSILNLEQQRQMLPFQNLAQYASLLLPAAGLGRQATGQSFGHGTTDTSGWNVSGNVGFGTKP